MNDIDLSRFTELLDAYGASPERWPADERAAALRLLQDNPAARAQQQQALALDAALDAFVVAPVSTALRDQLLRSAPGAGKTWAQVWRELWRDLGGWQLAAPAFAASLVLGALLPLWLDDSAADLPSEDLIAAMQLVDSFPELSP